MRKEPRLPLAELAPVLVALPRAEITDGQIKWPEPSGRWRGSDVFGNDHPLELEVGFGKGTFLLAAAASFPDRNYLGIEIERGLQLLVANRAIRKGLQNIKLIADDGGRLLSHHLAASTLAALHVYFPDPWWKKRHKKRRVFTHEFAAHAAAALAPGGVLYLATDVEEYFEVMTGLVAALPAFMPHEPALSPLADELPYRSNFERKAREKGSGVWRAAFRRAQ